MVRAHRPLSMYIGPSQALLAVDLQFRDELSEAGIARAIERIERNIRADYPWVKRIFIEARSLKPAA